jgi:hypothetical protein
MYRACRHREFVFIVPAGADLSSYSGEEATYIAGFQPFEPLAFDVDLKELAPPELNEFLDELERVGITFMRMRFITEPEEAMTDQAGID